MGKALYVKKETILLLSGYTFSLFGTGMSEPYLTLYLHQLRGLPLPFIGAIIGLSGLAGTLAIPLSGYLIDRLDENRVFLAALFVSAFGRISFAEAINGELATLATMLSGMGAAALWNALSVILAKSVTQDYGDKIFGLAFTLQNLGSGLGAACGGFLLAEPRLSSYQLLFFLDAATFLGFGLLSYPQLRRSLHTKRGTAQRHSLSPAHCRPSMDIIIVVLSIGYFLISIAMTGITSYLAPQWVIHQVHGSTNLIGQAFLINSLMIIVGQIIFIKIGRHEKKTQSLGVSTFLLAVSYAVLFFSGQIKDGSTAALLVMSSFALSAYGELLLFSNLPALVNERTSDEGRGRANSLMNGAWQVGGILGPVGAGIGAHQAKSILILFITIVLIAGLLFAHVQKKLNKERKG